MTRVSLAFVLIIASVFSGCVTAPVINKGEENQQLRSEVVSLESELARLRQENAALKRQLEQLVVSKTQVRIPNASEIQAALKKAGYYKGAVDGQIGTQTKEAIKKFQQANGINPDGVVGSRTWAALQRYTDK